MGYEHLNDGVHRIALPPDGHQGLQWLAILILLYMVVVWRQ